MSQLTARPVAGTGNFESKLGQMCRFVHRGVFQLGYVRKH